MRETRIKALAKRFLDCRIHGTVQLYRVSPGTKDWYYIPPLDSVVVEQKRLELRHILERRDGYTWHVYFGYIPELDTVIYWKCLDFV